MHKIKQPIKSWAVVTPGAAPAAQKPVGEGNFVADADRRLVIVGSPVPPTQSLLWQKRPVFPGGNPGYTYLVKAPEGEFAVFVGHAPNGSPTTGTPFEVWVNGGEAPRGLAELARSLSIDMRSQDRGWLRRKLEALAKTRGTPFELNMPDGRRVMAPSAVAAFAMLVLYRCEELGAFSDAKLASTPVLDALMAKREPKTTGNGSMAWYVDIDNPATGDDFVMYVKEAVLDGRSRPFSIWFSGVYPPSFDGLAKSLSLDAQVVEPEWLGRKLQQLSDVVEKRGEFFAHIPGATDGKKKSYPSTVAYIAAELQHRFEQLGWLTPEGKSVNNTGVIHLDEVRQSRHDAVQAGVKGADCDKCHTIGSVIRMDGCNTCTVCADSKCG